MLVLIMRTIRQKFHSHQIRRGVVLIYSVVALIVMIGMSSLAVDLGRVQAARAELQDAIDAAARYAVIGIGDGTAASKAITAAAENKVDGSPLVLLASDIESGNWNSPTKVFTVGGSPSNAVRITGRRTAARGTAVPLLFAQTIGMAKFDLVRTAIVTQATTSAAEIVGINGVTITGSSRIQRRASESGTVNVASNGTYSLSWGQVIDGNVLYRGTAPNPPVGSITGTKTLMSSDIAFATPTAPGGSTPLGAVNIGWAGGTIAAGNYTATSITVGGGGTVNVTGNVNIYCSGAVNLGNGCIVTSNTTNRLTIYMTNSSNVSLNMSSNLYIRLYAPLSSVTLNGSSPIIGSVVANTLSLNGSAILSYSSALQIPIAPTGGGSGSGGSISIVK